MSHQIAVHKLSATGMAKQSDMGGINTGHHIQLRQATVQEQIGALSPAYTTQALVISVLLIAETGCQQRNAVY
ncbi:MAG: hypothetical protein IPG31_08205 [Nitrosomonas sp.]|nr:hypothetical protein [Nitrosomonas sp.]